MAKQKDNSVNFFKNSKYNYSFVKYAVIFVFVVAAAVAAFVIHKKNPKIASNAVTVPTTYASDLPGWWYKQYFGSSVCKSKDCMSDADPDKDGLTNQQEYYFQTDPNNAYTAGDKMNDGELVAHGYDPTKSNHVAFSQSASDDSIVGESLLFANDVKSEVQDSLDINKVNIPMVPDSQLKIVADNENNFQQYKKQLTATLNKYFPDKDIQSIVSTIQSSDANQLNDVRNKSSLLALDLEDIPVPQTLLDFHKYAIAVFRLLPQIIIMPGEDQLASQTDVDVNNWYDNAQAFLAATQKLNLQADLLARK